jgi:GntR family transcriptional regulator, carbon starvation induced regulator
MAELVFGRLRTDIVNGRLRPGERLRLEQLQDEYAIGASPIREALLKLSTSGLVDSQAQKGFSVAPVSGQELKEITVLRAHLESLAVQWSIEQGDDDWEAEIIAAWHRFSRLGSVTEHSDEKAAMEWEARHERFHTALIAACRSSWLLHIRSLLQDQSNRYRRLASTRLARPHLTLDAHKVLMDAVLGRDVVSARQLMEHHVAQTERDVLSRLLDLETLNRK